MRTVSASQARKRFAALLDAAEREPVVIRRDRRDAAVLLSLRDYDRLRALEAAAPARAPEQPPEPAAAADAISPELSDIIADDDGG